MDKIKEITNGKFKQEEFECPCGCGYDIMNLDFIRKLYEARVDADIPFIVLSGARCPQHNKSVGGKRDSTHVPDYMPDNEAHGADIRFINGREYYKIVTALLRAGFTRIGHNDGGIHVDDGETVRVKTANVMWNYY